MKPTAVGVISSVLVGLGLLFAFEGLTSPKITAVRLRRLPALEFSAAVVGALCGYVLTGWPTFAAVAGLLGFFFPRLVKEHRSEASKIEATEALAEVASGLRDAVRGGLGLRDGLLGLSSWGPPAIRDHLQSLALEAAREGVPDAAVRFAKRVNNPAADLLAATLSFNERAGGTRVAEVLDALSAELFAEAKTVRELRARQARQRTSARIVALAPAVLLLLLRQINPGYLEAYGTASGQLVLAFASALVAGGYVAMVSVARLPQSPRISLGGRR